MPLVYWLEKTIWRCHHELLEITIGSIDHYFLTKWYRLRINGENNWNININRFIIYQIVAAWESLIQWFSHMCYCSNIQFSTFTISLTFWQVISCIPVSPFSIYPLVAKQRSNIKTWHICFLTEKGYVPVSPLFTANNPDHSRELNIENIHHNSAARPVE